MAASSATHEVSPNAASTLAAGSVSETPRSRFSEEGDSILARLANPSSSEVPGSAQRPIPTIGAAEKGAERPTPTSETEQDEDVRSSVSETAAVATSLRADLGSRVMARVQELEDDLSKFCADTSNRITVTCRNYILGRVFELARLCSDLRADAAAERAVVSSLQGQLVEARRETATMQRRVAVAERPAVVDVLSGEPGAFRSGASALAVPGSQVDNVGAENTNAPHGAGSGMSYAAALGSGTRLGAQGSSRNGPAGLQATMTQGAGLRQDYVAFLTLVGSTDAPAREVVRVLKSNIDPVAKGIRDVTLRHTRYGVTVFSQTQQSLINMRNAIEENNVTRNAITVRVPNKRNPHVRFSGVDPEIATQDFVRLLSERNPNLQLDEETCKVRVSFQERTGTMGHVVEVDPEAFKRIMSFSRISIGWTVVRAWEDVHVPTCTFCATYGRGRSSCLV
ncbi:hypothetical protein HPB51_027767 [Rhipicephalus microplus]|uniref:Gag-like protein n=1 Tax=Rhipicephalus microplus TaxID=6941 RepID=A0A9J6CZ74_RHIMP|nr:hypothetical protein HPB51_027767 [Rhipicephalus microplus]